MSKINLSTLFLAMSGLEIGLLIGLIVAIVVCLGIGLYVGMLLNKKSTDKKLGDVETRTKKMVEDATVECKALKKEAILEAKEQELKLRNEFEKESREKKNELNKQEQRLVQKEDMLDKKEDSLMKKSDELEKQKKELANREQDIKKTQEKINHQHDLMIQEIEKVAQLTKDEAKQLLTNEILDETRRDVALQVRNIEQTAKDEATVEAKKIISLAIQRCASDHASEITVSVVPLPSDDMKARIIGREGRNIRAIENATGIELIVDDTPEVVIVSGFDPVRREVARLTLERLIADGRIHPARIEETVEKVKKELDQEIKAAGESAMFEVGIFGLHPELIKIFGRLKYRTSY
jgi:ribonuclease Y